MIKTILGYRENYIAVIWEVADENSMTPVLHPWSTHVITVR